MKHLLLLLSVCLLLGCASAQKEGTDYNHVYMERCLATGMMAVGLDDTMREETGLPAIDGMYIANVEQGSAAYTFFAVRVKAHGVDGGFHLLHRLGAGD